MFSANSWEQPDCLLIKPCYSFFVLSFSPLCSLSSILCPLSLVLYSFSVLYFSFIHCLLASNVLTVISLSQFFTNTHRNPQLSTPQLRRILKLTMPTVARRTITAKIQTALHRRVTSTTKRHVQRRRTIMNTRFAVEIMTRPASPSDQGSTPSDDSSDFGSMDAEEAIQLRRKQRSRPVPGLGPINVRSEKCPLKPPPRCSSLTENTDSVSNIAFQKMDPQPLSRVSHLTAQLVKLTTTDSDHRAVSATNPSVDPEYPTSKALRRIFGKSPEELFKRHRVRAEAERLRLLESEQEVERLQIEAERQRQERTLQRERERMLELYKHGYEKLERSQKEQDRRARNRMSLQESPFNGWFGVSGSKRKTRSI